MTVYAGGVNTNNFIVAPQGFNSPIFISISYNPFRAALIKEDTILILGCAFGNLLYYDLSKPSAPSL